MYSLLHCHSCSSRHNRRPTARSRSLRQHVPSRYNHLRWWPCGHYPPPFISRRHRLGFQPRLSARSRHHPSLPWSQLQLRRLPQRTRILTLPVPHRSWTFLGFVGIFLPGITLAVAVQSFWRVLRRKKWVVDFLRGVNVTAVGLVFTAIYRLWKIGFLVPEDSRGQTLARDPFGVVVAAVTCSGE